MRAFSYMIVLFFFVGCQTQTSQEATICDCIESGQKANEISASFFKHRPTEAEREELKKAIAYRDSICTPFKNKLGEELQKLAKDCGALDFEPNKEAPKNIYEDK